MWQVSHFFSYKLLHAKRYSLTKMFSFFGKCQEILESIFCELNQGLAKKYKKSSVFGFDFIDKFEYKIIQRLTPRGVIL